MHAVELRVGLSAAAALVLAASAARAQTTREQSSCTYERCALHLEADPDLPTLPRLVQGIEARPVATHGVFIPTIPLFEASPDSVRLPYESFRHHIGVARGLFGVSLLAGAASAAVLLSHARTNTATIAATVGIDLGLAATTFVESERAASALETAIDRYNAALPDRR